MLRCDAHTCPGFPHPSQTFKPSAAAKAYLALAVAQAGFLFFVCWRLASADGGGNDAATNHAIVGTLVTAVTLYFTVDSIVSENALQFGAAVAASCLMTMSFALSLDLTALGGWWEDNAPVVLWVSAGCNVLALALAWPVQSSFGYVIYRSIGADARLQRLYRAYEVFFCLLKLDVFLDAIMTVMVVLLRPAGVDAGPVLAAAAFSAAVWAPVGWAAVVRERARWLWPFWLWSPVEVAYLALSVVDFKLGSDADNLIDAETHEFVAFAAIAVVVRLALMLATYRCQRGFGQGLRERVFEVGVGGHMVGSI